MTQVLLVIDVDCPDCGKYQTTKKEIPHVFYCDNCRRKLTALNFNEVGAVWATNRTEALEKFNRKN